MLVFLFINENYQDCVDSGTPLPKISTRHSDKLGKRNRGGWGYKKTANIGLVLFTLNALKDTVYLYVIN